jgi:hypothetical protein
MNADFVKSVADAGRRDVLVVDAPAEADNKILSKGAPHVMR